MGLSFVDGFNVLESTQLFSYELFYFPIDLPLLGQRSLQLPLVLTYWCMLLFRISYLSMLRL